MLLSTLPFKVSAQEGVEGEILYITDQLHLSLYERAEKKSKIIQYLTSGERLEVTQKSGPYAFVTTESGKKGWVKRGFLVSKLPSVLLLKQELEKTETLVEELNKLANSGQIIDQYEKDMDTLTDELNAMTEAKEAVQTEVAELKQQVEEKQMKSFLGDETTKKKTDPVALLSAIVLAYWRYLLPLCFGLILIGYFIAGRVLKARLRKKFQGIKVW